jgi:hypothetical protein
MENKLLMMPAARQTYTAISQATVFSWDLVAPKGKQLQGLRIDARINTGGLTVGTARFHKCFKEIKVLSEAGVVMHLLQDAIPMATVLSQAFKEDQFYDATPGNTDVMRNPAVVTNGNNYDFTANIHSPVPGTRFSVQISIDAFTTAFPGTVAITTVAFDIQVTAIWAKNLGQPQYMILGDMQAAISTKKYLEVSKFGLFNATEWSTIMATLKAGMEGMSPAQISMLADQSNDYLRGLATNGTGTATRTLPVLDPGTNANVFSLLYWLDNPGMLELQATAAQTFFAIIWTKAAKLASVTATT